MSNVDHSILGPDTLAALAALANNMVRDCQTVAAVKTSEDLVPALAGVAERGHEAGVVAHGDIARKILAGATKGDILGFMNQDKGSRGGKALAGSIMRGLRALAAKDSPSGKAIAAWLDGETLRFDGEAKQFHFAPKVSRDSLKTRLVALLGEGSDEELIAKVESLIAKESAAMKAAAISESKAQRLADELATAKAALAANAAKAGKASRNAA